jgi:hypothetical protein
MHIDIRHGAPIEATRDCDHYQLTVEFRSTAAITASVLGDPSVYLNFKDERDAEKMAFDILHRLGHRFNDGKHTPAPKTPDPKSEGYHPKTVCDVYGNDVRILELTGWKLHPAIERVGVVGELADDLAFILNWGREQRELLAKHPNLVPIYGERKP